MAFEFTRMVEMFVCNVIGILVLCASARASCDTENLSLNGEDESPSGILKMLHEGEKKIHFTEDDRDMIVLMGITGSGKTTFALYIGNHDNELFSLETRPNSGEFIIEDTKKRSSAASRTLESCTLIPGQFYYDGATLIDMPGFSDTRLSVAYDIAATYFIKKVLDYARSVKIIFLVNHSHVKIGEDRGRFTELVRHITTLVRNVSKFNDGIALVATKVVNLFSPGSPPDQPYVPDDVVIEGIADFLNDAKSFYSQNNQSEAVELMNIFLQSDDDGKHSRLGIFRRPDKAGPLRDVKILQENKSKLKELIESNLNFVEKNDTDFGYTLSEKSKNTLHRIREEMLRNTSASISALGGRIEARFNELQASTTELDHLVSIFNESVLDVGRLKRIPQFVNYLRQYADISGVNITAKDLEALRDGEEHLNFLIEISGEVAIDWTWTIQDGMKETVDYLKHTREWYVIFLGALYDHFSGYDVQKGRSEYDASDVIKQVYRFQSVTARSVKLTELDILKSLLKKVGNQHLMRIFDSMGGAVVTQRQLHFLQVLLEATLNHLKTDTLCKGNKFTAQGRYVLLSQVVDKLRTCVEQIRYVEIFALEKVFVDTNMNFTGKGVHQVTIIAPLWITVGRVEVTLNGAAAGGYERSAPNGQRSSENGHDGKPGVAGESAGHFVGIGANFVSGNQLTISAVGGRGGKGQGGGHGQRGMDGKEAKKFEGTVDRNWPILWRDHKYEKISTDESSFVTNLLSLVCIVYRESLHRVEIPSLVPTNGGNGGNGGRGGRGGHRGKIIILSLDSVQNSSVKCITKDGDSGESGESGKGGEKGTAGRTLVENYIEKKTTCTAETSLSFKSYERPTEESAKNGEDGHEGWNDVNMSLPANTAFRDPRFSINEYKVFAQKDSHSHLHNLHTSTQKQFLHKLNHYDLAAFGL